MAFYNPCTILAQCWTAVHDPPGRVQAVAKPVTGVCRACFKVLQNCKYIYTFVVLFRWLSVRLEMLGICIVFGAALFVAVLLPRNAGLAGLALTSALNLTG